MYECMDLREDRPTVVNVDDVGVTGETGRARNSPCDRPARCRVEDLSNEPKHPSGGVDRRKGAVPLALRTMLGDKFGMRWKNARPRSGSFGRRRRCLPQTPAVRH